MKDHFVIPFFIIHKGCPFKCVFCDQKSISGSHNVDPLMVPDMIEKYLSSMPKAAHVEIGFFGGTFTGLARAEQEAYLKGTRAFIKSGRVKGIRLSTRPDFIDSEKLDLLKEYGVTCVELGVQSMSDKVLELSGRGYTSKDVNDASKMVISAGFDLAHQMMLALPGSTFQDEFYTARRAKELGAKGVRIYPLVVVKNTELADLWQRGDYVPLEKEEALERSAKLILYFESNGIKVLRCGLHPSEGLATGGDSLAGPFDVSFRQKAENIILVSVIKILGAKEVMFSPEDEAALRRAGAVVLDRDVELVRDSSVPRGCLRLKDASGKMTLVGRKDMARLMMPELI